MFDEDKNLEVLRKIVHLLSGNGSDTIHGPWKVGMTVSSDPKKVTCEECLRIMEKPNV